MRKEIRSKKGAPPKGLYSQAIVAEGPLVFVSGQGPVNPATGEAGARFATFSDEEVHSAVDAAAAAATPRS